MLLCFAFLVLSAVENVVFPSVVARFDVDRTSESYYIIAYYCGFALCHFLLFTKLGLWFVHRNRFFKHDLRVRFSSPEIFFCANGNHWISDRDSVGGQSLAIVVPAASYLLPRCPGFLMFRFIINRQLFLVTRYPQEFRLLFSCYR